MMIEFLLRHGAHINAQTDSGWTPLHAAVDIEGDGALQAQREATASVTKLLLRYGADPRVADNCGRTPLDIAERYGHEAAKGLLQGNTTT